MVGDYNRELGGIQARLENVEEQLKSVPTRPELALFTAALENIAESQKALAQAQQSQGEQIRTFSDYVNRWKGAALVLVALGAILTSLIELLVSFWNNHAPPS